MWLALPLIIEGEGNFLRCTNFRRDFFRNGRKVRSRAMSLERQGKLAEPFFKSSSIMTDFRVFSPIFELERFGCLFSRSHENLALNNFAPWLFLKFCDLRWLGIVLAPFMPSSLLWQILSKIFYYWRKFSRLQVLHSPNRPLLCGGPGPTSKNLIKRA